MKANTGEVALRKESVDRNNYVIRLYRRIVKSLSARRAWIEISVKWQFNRYIKSLSARRAWIEIVPSDKKK